MYARVLDLDSSSPALSPQRVQTLTASETYPECRDEAGAPDEHAGPRAFSRRNAWLRSAVGFAGQRPRFRMRPSAPPSCSPGMCSGRYLGTPRPSPSASNRAPSPIWMNRMVLQNLALAGLLRRGRPRRVRRLRRANRARASPVRGMSFFGYVVLGDGIGEDACQHHLQLAQRACRGCA